jgi:hypothetical protein
MGHLPAAVIAANSTLIVPAEKTNWGDRSSRLDKDGSMRFLLSSELGLSCPPWQQIGHPLVNLRSGALFSLDADR